MPLGKALRERGHKNVPVMATDLVHREVAVIVANMGQQATLRMSA